MPARSKIAVSAAMIFASALAALGKGVGVPNIDIQNICRASEREIRLLFSDVTRDVFGPCMEEEQEARDQLIKDWATIPAFDKERCVQPKQYLPSYIEWQTCIKMTEDVRKMLKEQPAAMPADAAAGRRSRRSRSGSGTNQCPAVRWRKDGLIDNMNAC